MGRAGFTSLVAEQDGHPRKPHMCPAPAFPTMAITPCLGWQEAPSRHSPSEQGHCIHLTLPTSCYHSCLMAVWSGPSFALQGDPMLGGGSAAWSLARGCPLLGSCALISDSKKAQL